MQPKSTFTFTGYTWSQTEGKATFTYKIDHNNELFTFSEVLTLPKDTRATDVPEELLKNLFIHVSLALGVSYYKLFCPKEIMLVGINLTKEQAAFWNTVYTKGLGEFFYQNQIDFQGLIAFPFSEAASSSAISLPRQDRSLVGIGGGKDSIVAGELLKAQHKQFTNFVINQHPIRDEIITLLGGGEITVSRKIDPRLFELNKRSDTYNGHIPVSAQYAFIGILLGALYDYRYIVVSNEHSSNYGNVMYQGMEVNHQWSKSLEFETLFQDYVRQYITPDVTYFSLLRPLTELAIVKRFVQHPQYFPHFSSCNRNFKITGEGQKQKWCGECPKCAFAFAMLAAFLPKEQLVNIFGQNLFAKEALLQTYKELLGVAAIKPFDCVGTPDEVRVAFYLAMQKGEYTNDVSMQFFQKEVLPQTENIEQLQKQQFQKVAEHRIPKEFQNIV